MTKTHVYILVALFTVGFSCEGTPDSYSIEYTLRKGERDGGLWKRSITTASGSATPRPLLPKNEESSKAKHQGTPTLNDFGILDMRPRIVPYGRSPESYISVNKIESSCEDLEGCREKLMEKHDYRMYKFFILPDGKILEGRGWPSGLLLGRTERFSIGLLKIPKKPPTAEAMEAYAFFVQMGITLKKIKENSYTDFSFLLPKGAIAWDKTYKNVFDSGNSVSKVKVFGDVEFLTKKDWGAVRTIRRLNRMTTKADFVEVLLTNSSSSMPEKCLKEVRRLQRKQMKTFSDVFSNFIVCGDGRIYEGLGWNLSRKANTVYFDILVESEDSIPWTQVLAAFTLKLREGMKLGKISEDHTIVTPTNLSDTVSKKIAAVGSLAKGLTKDNSVLALRISGREGNISSSNNTDEEIHTLEHPISSVRFIQTDAVCAEPRNCIPFVKRLGGETIRSPEELTSNFYFIADSVVYEGLGWDLSHRRDEVALEFPTVDPHALPSNQSMFASMLLLREGVINGYLRPDYTPKVGRGASVEFKNMVRFWEERVRG